LVFVVLSGISLNWHWLWLPFLWGCQIVFLCGISLLTSCLNVYVRDIRYLVESINVILFWLVPIFYPFSMISEQYKEIYRLNPVAAMTFALRNIFIDGTSPATSLLLRLVGSSALMLVLGFLVFRRLKPRFYNYL
jgi:ABC-type polysaccharide/polyol phosphate export permease